VLHIRPAKVMFLLGRPCSGKTSAIHLITKHLQSENLGYIESQISVHNDYRLLLTKFECDKTQKDFEPGPSKGFRVKNFDILDECLRELNMITINELDRKQFIIIEFSRKNYVSALMNFDPKILNSCTLFYLQTPLDICIKRNEGRKDKESTGESGYVPPDILETYYKDDDIGQLSKKFAKRLVQIDNREDGDSHLRQKIIEEVSKRLGSWLLESGR
jgi:tRNA uridine 5-carbamoylmethylation protein Kti12